jgi:Excalibur calcium-binding domain
MRRKTKRLALLCVAGLMIAAVAPTGVMGDTGSITVMDAGGGSMSVTVKASVEDCGEFCGWFAVLRERHASLPCANVPPFTPNLSGFEETPGTFSATWTFKPFFPRQAKLCLYVQATKVGTELLSEVVYAVPSGYGHLRSTGYNCSDFLTQTGAQYYLKLYPDDPSRLDADHDGIACESNSCPCGAEPIPAEPEESTPPSTVPVFTPVSEPQRPPKKSGLSRACRQARATKESKRRSYRRARYMARHHPGRRTGHIAKWRYTAFRNAVRRAGRVCRTA